MSNKLRYLHPVASYSSPLCLRLAIYHFKSELQLNFLKLSIPLSATASSSRRPTAFDSVTSNSFQFRYVRQLSSPLRATAFKFATSNSFRFRYVRQLSSPLRPTAFDSVTRDSFQVRYVQQLSILLHATAFKFYQCMNHSLIISVSIQDRLLCLDTRSVVLFISSRSLTCIFNLFY